MEVNDRLNVKFYEHPQLCLRLIIIIFKLLEWIFFNNIEIELMAENLKNFYKNTNFFVGKK